MAIIGTETEYGILAPDEPAADPEVLSAAVVDSYPGPGTPSLAETHNRVLGNGARLYVDHGHPEYSTPETTNAADATAHDLAGDAIVLRAAAEASRRLGVRLKLFKNNTDGKGSSYGFHENYLLSRALEWESIVDALPTFLVTRVVFTGAGRVGLGTHGDSAEYQLSQRADFFERVSGLDTTANRGLVNTRDEPHARPSRWRRLHVIAGDANRSPYATWLKLATASLSLAALEAGFTPPGRLADPVAAFRTVSRDLSVRAALPLVGGGTASAIDLQRRHRDACAAYLATAEFAEGDEIVREWSEVLDDLDRDPASTADRLDWTAKLGLLEAVRERQGLAWDAPRVAQLDLAWADLDASASPFSALERAGRLVGWIEPATVAEAVAGPPTDTRAFARGYLVANHPDAVVAATWDSVHVRDTRGLIHNLRMSEPHGHARGSIDVSATIDRLCADWDAATAGRGAASDYTARS